MLTLARPAVVAAIGALTIAACGGANRAPTPPTAPSSAPVGSAPPSAAASPGGSVSARPAQDFCSADGFCWITPAPFGANLTGVWVADANDAWAAGPRGALLRWNGSAWTWVRTGFAGRISAVWGAARDDVWAAGDALLHFDGTRWAVVHAAPVGHRYLAIHGSGPGDVWAVGTGATAAHFDGRSWTDASLPFVPGDLAASQAVSGVGVYAAAPGAAWVVGSGYGAVLRLQGGTWQRVDGIVVGETDAVWGSGPADVWIAGAARYETRQPRIGHHLHHWDGTAWTGIDVPSAEDAHWTGVGGSSPRDVWLVAASPRDLPPDRAHWDGTAWTTARVDAPASALHVNGATGFAVGNGGAIARLEGGRWTVQHAGNQLLLNDVSAAGGIAWVPMLDPGAGTTLLRVSNGTATPVGDRLDDIVYRTAAAGPGALWAATYGNGLARFDGSRWTTQVGGITGTVAGLWASGATDVWAIRGSEVVHWDGAAATRFALDAQFLERAWGSGPDDVWAVGDVGFAQHWDGAAWTKVALPVNGLALDVWGRAQDDVWIAGYDGLALHFDGRQWSVVPTGTHATLNRVVGDSAGTVWLVGEDGTVLEWGGTSLRPLDAGTFGTFSGAAWDPVLGLVLAGDEGVLNRAPRP